MKLKTKVAVLKRLLSLVLAGGGIMGTLVGGGTLSSNTRAADLKSAFPGWTTDDWTVREENGEAVLVNQGSAIERIYSKAVASTAELEYDIYIDSVNSSVDANVGALYTFTNDHQVFFEYNTVYRFARVGRFVGGVYQQIGDIHSMELDAGTWHHFTIKLEENHFCWYIDQELILTTDDTYGDITSSGSWIVQSYNNSARLRRLTFYNETPIYEPECADCDFEFTSAASVEVFSAVGGSVAYDNGALVYKIDRANSYLTSPTIVAEVGTAYSAKMDVKNTIMFRLKNDTDAKQIKVYFKTDKVLSYSEENAVTVSVKPHGGYQTVYANFSSCPAAASGYLKAFKIIPVGAESGSIIIDAITFEREKAFYDYAGEIYSCTSDGEIVTVKGRLDSAYAGKTVKIYELKVSNYTESVDGLTPIAEAVADGKNFTVKIPFMDGKITRLSNLFMATVDGVKISDRFMVENYRDFTENIYQFSLPELTVKVTDNRFGAKGDGFTNDNSAIQAAIDYVTAQGGGTVVLPGDDSYYGRRYVATNIKLKDNVELRIEEGAVLWQSPRAEDYEYDVFYGHDVVITGINWTHAFLCHNYPLIQGYEAKNIRVTGGGTVRMVDTGGENLDGVNGATIWTGCKNRIHIIPFGMYGCTNVEISDITILRSNGYHAALLACENAYVGNLVCKEITCASGDGIALGVGTHQVLIDRFVIFSNDDAVTLWSTYDEPRGLTWWKSRPEQDNSIRNIKVKSSHIYSGHGITFIPWGTDNPDLSKNEIKNIEVTDCILDGPYSVGTWPDNPYFGGPFTNTETDDFSPVKDVYIHDNEYRSNCTLECITGTNIITDCGITSHNQFVFGNFERYVRGHNNWISGLSNWSYELGEGSTVEAVEVGRGHEGKLTGTGSLYQGLYLKKGTHRLTIDTNLISGSGIIFARDSLTGEVLASVDIPKGDCDKTRLVFLVTKDTNVSLGVELKEKGEVYVDNASITSKGLVANNYIDRFEENFETLVYPTFDYNSRFTVEQDENNQYASAMASSGSAVQTVLAKNATSFDMRYHFRISNVTSTTDGNVGLAFSYVNINNCYFLEFNTVNNYIQLREFVKGTERIVISPVSYTFKTNEWMQIGVRVDNGKLELYIDGKLVSSGAVTAATGKALAFSDYNVAYDIDNVIISDAGTLDMTEIVSVSPPKKEYVLYFLVDNGDPVPSPQVLTEGEAMAAVEDLVLDGYIFKGWAINGEIVDLDTFRMPASGVVMTAVWEKISDETTKPGDETNSEDDKTDEPEDTNQSVDTDSSTSEPSSNIDADATENHEKGFMPIITAIVLIALLIPLGWLFVKRNKKS